MPHLIINSGAGLSTPDLDRLLRAAHQALLGSGEVKKQIDLKSRVVRSDLHLVGENDPEATFVHAELRLLSGRSSETRQKLADLVLEAISEGLGPEVQVSVEVRELPAEYAKRKLG